MGLGGIAPSRWPPPHTRARVGPFTAKSDSILPRLPDSLPHLPRTSLLLLEPLDALPVCPSPHPPPIRAARASGATGRALAGVSKLSR